MRTLSNVIEDVGLRVIMAEYICDLEVRWDEILRQSKMKRFVVPVVGVQGSGKSTLLNALLFDQPVLPIDTNETTCVPVEVVHGDSDHAVVHFKHGPAKSIELTEESLARYADQTSNPGNKRGVRKIQVMSNSELLADGVVMVDLPGLGSLTVENREITIQYLQEASSLIYLLRTVPPVTRSEMIDLALIWPRLPIVFFMQNRGTDESDDECKSSLEYSQGILRNVAEGFGRSLELKEPRIDTVIAYDAYAGRLKGDRDVVKGSGLPEFKSRLKKVFKGWPAHRDQMLQEAVLADLSTALARIDTGIRDNREEQEVANQRLQAEMERRFKALKAAQKRVDAMRQQVEEYTVSESKRVDKWANSSKQELRNTIRSLMRKGTVDGPLLDTAIEDEASLFTGPAWLEARDAARMLVNMLGEKLANLDDWTKDEIRLHGPGLDKTLKWEEILPTGGAIAGAAGGALAGGKLGGIAGAKIGLLIGGPAGAVVGSVAGAIVFAGVGFLGSLLGSRLGAKGRDIIRTDRAEASEPAVFAVIEEHIDSVAEAQKASANDFAEELKGNLQEWIQTEQMKLEQEHKKRKADIAAPIEQRNASLNKLENDRKYVSGMYQKLENLAL